MFSGCTVSPDSKESELEVATKRFLNQKWGPTAIFSGVDISVLFVHLLQQIVLSEGHKNYFKDWCRSNSQPTFLFLTI